jgi:hypothetical protein
VILTNVDLRSADVDDAGGDGEGPDLGTELEWQVWEGVEGGHRVDLRERCIVQMDVETCKRRAFCVDVMGVIVRDNGVRYEWSILFDSEFERAGGKSVRVRVARRLDRTHISRASKRESLQ